MAMAELLLEKAKWAEEARRYEDMAKFMKQLVESGQCLSSEGRNLLSVAYKNVVGTRRNAWRVVTGNLPHIKDEEVKCRATEYQKCIQEELTHLCEEVVELIDSLLSKLKEDLEGLVFYTKMKGDYFRYLCEVVSEEDRKENVLSSEECYEEALKHAKDLTTVHPIRLGLVLNFSVFYYEIKNTPDIACKMAKKAFDEAIGDLDSLKEDSYKDSTLIMQLLRDNITLWTSSEDYDQS